jgi:hypothetical protein
LFDSVAPEVKMMLSGLGALINSAILSRAFSKELVALYP